MKMINENLIQYAAERINPRDMLEFVLPKILDGEITSRRIIDAYQPVYQEPYFDIDITKLPS